MMTEPDLVTIGDYTVIDEASVIGHINSRGVFKLNPLTIGKHCTLKSFSCLLSGAAMEDHSMMLEHTLVMGGETVDSNKAWQGWPRFLHHLRIYALFVALICLFCSQVQMNVKVPYLYNRAIVVQEEAAVAKTRKNEDVSIQLENDDIEMCNRQTALVLDKGDAFEFQ